MKDLLRTLLAIRQQRKPAPVGALPKVGTLIVRGQVKMSVSHPVSQELWEWLVLSGWRNLPVKNDRRKGLRMPEGALKMLISTDPLARDRLHSRLLEQAQPEP